MSALGATLDDEDALVFTGDALPTEIPLGQFEHAAIGAVGDDFQQLLTAEITHVTVVPEPAQAAGAALLALTGIVARRRKGRVQPRPFT
jgi:MYXO-CTERM domain-containing protein